MYVDLGVTLGGGITRYFVVGDTLRIQELHHFNVQPNQIVLAGDMRLCCWCGSNLGVLFHACNRQHIITSFETVVVNTLATLLLESATWHVLQYFSSGAKRKIWRETTAKSVTYIPRILRSFPVIHRRIPAQIFCSFFDLKCRSWLRVDSIDYQKANKSISQNLQIQLKIAVFNGQFSVNVPEASSTKFWN